VDPWVPLRGFHSDWLKESNSSEKSNVQSEGLYGGPMEATHAAPAETSTAANTRMFVD
jgi:hypothetical protein